jgi:predicted nucleic-acid-binding protein
MEHPQEVIRMLFIAVILIFSIIIIINLMSEMESINIYRTNNLKYNVIATKILYSSDCYALEDSYTMDSETRHQVHAGILDASKFVKGRLDTCTGKGQSEITITYLDSKDSFSDSTICEGKWKDTRNVLVSIDKNGERKGGLAEIKVCV